MEDNYQVENDEMTRWLEIEQWFVRILGADLLVLAILGLIAGTLYNPDNETAITIINIVIAVALGAGGVWTLYSSRKLEQVEKMLDGYIEQGSSPSYVYAGVQSLVAILFLMEGFSRGQIVMLLLAVTMFATAGFFVWRGQQIGKYQD